MTKTSVDDDGSETVELIRRARAGDREALNDLLARQLPPLQRWASGRLPRWARDGADTSDLVQETVMQTLKRLDHFEPRGQGALQAYLRQAIVNRVRNVVRKAANRPMPTELDSDIPDERTSPLEAVIGWQVLGRYEAGLAQLSDDERDAIVGRIELGLTYAELAVATGKPSPDAARMMVVRGLVKLAAAMGYP